MISRPELRTFNKLERRYDDRLPEPLIYSTWVETFKKMLIEDELGPISSQLI